MNFPIKFDTIKSGWSIIYSERSQVIIFKMYFFLKIDFVLANKADPDKVPYYAYNLGLHCLSKYPFWGSWSPKG